MLLVHSTRFLLLLLRDLFLRVACSEKCAACLIHTPFSVIFPWLIFLRSIILSSGFLLNFYFALLTIASCREFSMYVSTIRVIPIPHLCPSLVRKMRTSGLQPMMTRSAYFFPLATSYFRYQMCSSCFLLPAKKIPIMARFTLLKTFHCSWWIRNGEKAASY